MNKKSWLFVIFAALILLGCKKEKEADEPRPIKDDTGGSELINSPSQFSATIDGESIFYSEGKNISNFYGSNGSNSGGSSNYTYQSSLYHSSLKNLIVLNKGALSFSGSQPSNEVFKGFFSTGVVPYSKNATNGIEIIWYDLSGVAWSTSDGSGDQTGSTFSIEEIKGVTMQSQFYVKLIAKFNCKLYNGTQQKVLSNGVFVGLMAAN